MAVTVDLLLEMDDMICTKTKLAYLSLFEPGAGSYERLLLFSRVVINEYQCIIQRVRGRGWDSPPLGI